MTEENPVKLNTGWWTVIAIFEWLNTGLIWWAIWKNLFMAKAHCSVSKNHHKCTGMLLILKLYSSLYWAIESLKNCIKIVYNMFEFKFKSPECMQAKKWLIYSIKLEKLKLIQWLKLGFNRGVISFLGKKFEIYDLKIRSNISTMNQFEKVKVQ